MTDEMFTVQEMLFNNSKALRENSFSAAGSRTPGGRTNPIMKGYIKDNPTLLKAQIGAKLNEITAFASYHGYDVSLLKKISQEALKKGRVPDLSDVLPDTYDKATIALFISDVMLGIGEDKDNLKEGGKECDTDEVVTFDGKKGCWRTVNGQAWFFPSDGSDPPNVSKKVLDKADDPDKPGKDGKEEKALAIAATLKSGKTLKRHQAKLKKSMTRDAHSNSFCCLEDDFFGILIAALNVHDVVVGLKELENLATRCRIEH